MTIKIIFIPSKLHHYNPTNFTTLITICLLLLSSPLPKFTNAQDGYPTEDRVTKSEWTNNNPPPHPMTGVIFIIFTGVIILVMILYYYFREACILRSAQVSRSAAAGIRFSLRNPSQQRPRGLDPEIIKTFPVFTYSEVKDLKEVMKKGQLECAVCLSVFEDDEKLRLLPKCDHVFHPQCVDVWFESHSTCPYCRADLVPEVDKSNHHVSVIVAEYENGRGGGSGGCGCSCSCGGGSDDVVLRMEEGIAGGGGSSGDGTRRSAAAGVAKGDGSTTADRANNNTSSDDSNRSITDQFRRFGGSFRKLRRWNSTGHLNSERFTLRLPTNQLQLCSGAGGETKQDDEVVAVPLNRTRSCIVLQSTSS